MRKLFLASLLGATVAVATGCEGLNKLLTPPAVNKTPGQVTDTSNTPGTQIDPQAQLQQAAGFASNLQQAAGFGVILNAPTSQLQQAAGLGGSKYKINSLAFENDRFRGEIGSGDLVASGSINGLLPTGDGIYQAFEFDLEVATASKIPALEGARITGRLALSADSSDQGLKGEMLFTEESGTATPVDFTYAATGTWKLTGPVMIDNVMHYTHLEVDSSRNGTGWIAKDKNGSTSMRVANCTGKDGMWTVKLLANPDATSSISMPW